MNNTTKRDADMASVENMGQAISEKLGPRFPRYNRNSGVIELSGEQVRMAGPERVRVSVSPKNEIMAAIFGGLFAGTLIVKNKYGYARV